MVFILAYKFSKIYKNFFLIALIFRQFRLIFHYLSYQKMHELIYHFLYTLYKSRLYFHFFSAILRKNR